MKNFKELSHSELETSGGINKLVILTGGGYPIALLLLGPYLIGNYHSTLATKKAEMLSSNLNVNSGLLSV